MEKQLTKGAVYNAAKAGAKKAIEEHQKEAFKQQLIGCAIEIAVPILANVISNGTEKIITTVKNKRAEKKAKKESVKEEKES